MSKCIVIRLIDGSEYFVNPSKNKCVIAMIDAYTGKKTRYEPDNSWIIHGVWYNKLFGKGTIELNEFVKELTLKGIHYSDKKGKWKYGIHETHDGVEKMVAPLDDYGISFIRVEEVDD